MMESFKQYFTESTHISIDMDPAFALTQIEKINEDLDTITLPTFVNSGIFVNAVRGTLERYGIVLPAHSNMQQLSLEGEWVYQLGESGYFVYMVHDLTDEGAVEGYATIADAEELEDLAELNDDEDEDDVEEPTPVRRRLPPAARDDDSGNTAEYA
jgi:hypothetical protein